MVPANIVRCWRVEEPSVNEFPRESLLKLFSYAVAALSYNLVVILF